MARYVWIKRTGLNASSAFRDGEDDVCGICKRRARALTNPRHNRSDYSEGGASTRRPSQCFAKSAPVRRAKSVTSLRSFRIASKRRSRSALFHIEFALNGKHVMEGCLALAPKAEVNPGFAHAELVKRDLRQPKRQHGIDVKLLLVGICVQAQEGAQQVKHTPRRPG